LLVDADGDTDTGVVELDTDLVLDVLEMLSIVFAVLLVIPFMVDDMFDVLLLDDVLVEVEASIGATPIYVPPHMALLPVLDAPTVFFK